MENTPECRALPFVKLESEEVKKLCQRVKLQVIEPLRRKKPVLEALRSCKIFHFAGHGQSHPSDPLQSHLLLEDWKKDQLTLASFLETTTLAQPPFLAYLSACSTGQIQDERLLDEGLHLINAFQLAGFQHVIGTLWDVEDELCGEVAKDVYDILLQEFTHQSVSFALHKAVKRYRDRWRDHVLSKPGELTGVRTHHVHIGRDYGSQIVEHKNGLEWVPFVHFGG